ncbi:unnamed protein product, partial [Rotaria sp. Silwood2]
MHYFHLNTALEEYESLKQLPIQRQSSSQCLPPQHSNSLVTNNTGDYQYFYRENKIILRSECESFS